MELSCGLIAELLSSTKGEPKKYQGATIFYVFRNLLAFSEVDPGQWFSVKTVDYQDGRMTSHAKVIWFPLD